MGPKTGIYLLALAALALAATNGTTVATPSGNIHITYVDNGTLVVVNINNNKVITVNIKMNVTVGNEQYFLHVVGKAKGQFDNATVSRLLSLLNKTKDPDALIAAFKSLIDTNQTKKLEVKAMLTGRSPNATAPNATYLKMKIEYELERRLSKLNKTLTAEDEYEIKIITRDLNKTADVLAAMAARLAKYNISDANTLMYIAQRLKQITPDIKKLELYINGTEVKIKFNKNTYTIEIEKENKKGKDSEHEEKGSKYEDKNSGVGKDEEKKDNAKSNDKDKSKSNDKEEKEKKSDTKDEKEDKKSKEDKGKKGK
jgi:hypothetical protein